MLSNWCRYVLEPLHSVNFELFTLGLYLSGRIYSCRRKMLYGEIRKQLGVIWHELARQKECQIIEGHLVSDHVHMCIKIPPKYAVASVIGFLKGKSALAIARQFSGKVRNLTGEHFWARGYAVSTVGFELEAVKKYIREQEQLDQDGRF